MARVIKAVGPPVLRDPLDDGFAALVRSITYQQLAGAAAAAVDVIARRSAGLMSFVERYRKMAELPPPSHSPAPASTRSTRRCVSTCRNRWR